MSNVIVGHNQAESIAASMSRGDVPTNAFVSLPATSNQTLLSLISSGQVSMQSPGVQTQQAGLVYPSLAAQPAILPAGEGSPAAPGGGNVDVATAPVALDVAAVTGTFGGS
jgi:hypothetical protein